MISRGNLKRGCEMILPSIDLMKGKAVQLVQGKEKALERENVLALAEEFSLYGELQVIDLDAALGKGNNAELVKEIIRKYAARVGGGIRSVEKARELVFDGAKKVIIGTRANKEFLEKLCKEIGRKKIIVAIDSRNGKVSIKGWQKETEKSPFELVKELEDYCSEFLYTCIEKEGKMKGIDWKTVRKLKKLTKNKITIAGGISSIEEIKKLEEREMNSVLGMALYTGKIDLAETFIENLDWNKCNGLVPTIVQETDSKQVLMFAYSSKESLKKALKERKGIYYSRSKGKIWIKGKTSGNSQELKQVKWDCDKDCLLFEVKQKNIACHNGRYSCFGEKETDVNFLNELFALIEQRKQEMPKSSYTAKLFKEKDLLIEKIREECGEVIEAEETQDRENFVWEIADLLYFLSVLAVKNEISLEQIARELSRRRK